MKNKITFNAAQIAAIRQRKQEGASYDEIVKEIAPQYPCCTYNQLWHKVKNTLNQSKDLPPVQTYTYNPPEVEYKNGETTYTGIIQVKNNKITPQTVMEGFDLDPTEWEVVSYKTGNWEQNSKANGLITLTSARITVKPKTKLDEADVAAFFETYHPENIRPAVKKLDIPDQGRLLEIDIADLHIGLLTTTDATGTEYNVEIAGERLLQTVQDIADRARTRQDISCIRLVTLGDILHVDTNYATTSGTQQDCENRISKLYSQAVEMLDDCLQILNDLHLPIEYVYVPGNHDRQTGEYIANTLKAIYRHNPNISFDVGTDPCKVKTYGNSVVGYHHGDMPKKNIASWLATNYRKEYGEAKFAEVHIGHLHNEAVWSDGGVIVRRLPSLCESSYWEHQQGYAAQRGVMCFIWHPTNGLQETWNYAI